MKFAVFCLATAMAAVYVLVDAGVQPSNRLQKRSADPGDAQTEADKTYIKGTLQVIELPSVQLTPQTVVVQQPTPQPVVVPQPIIVQQPVVVTTTADPRCPEGPNKPCRELPLGQMGLIWFRNDGWVTLQFKVDYMLGNRRVKKDSGPFTWTIKKSIDIPAEATDLMVTLQGVGLFSVTSDILKRQYKYPVIRCFASADALTAKEVGCN